jgi:hypothetical protein
MRRLSCRTGYWDRSTGRRPASWLTSCTSSAFWPIFRPCQNRDLSVYEPLLSPTARAVGRGGAGNSRATGLEAAVSRISHSAAQVSVLTSWVWTSEPDAAHSCAPPTSDRNVAAIATRYRRTGQRQNRRLCIPFTGSLPRVTRPPTTAGQALTEPKHKP